MLTLCLMACVVVVPLVLMIIAWLMLWDAGKVYDVSPPKQLEIDHIFQIVPGIRRVRSK